MDVPTKHDAVDPALYAGPWSTDPAQRLGAIPRTVPRHWWSSLRCTPSSRLKALTSAPAAIRSSAASLQA